MKKVFLLCLLAVMLCSLMLPVYAETEPLDYEEEYDDFLIETEEYADIEETFSEWTEDTYLEEDVDPDEDTVSTDAAHTHEEDAVAPDTSVTNTGSNAVVTTGSTGKSTSLEDLLVPIGFMGGGAVLLIVAIILLATAGKKSK